MAGWIGNGPVAGAASGATSLTMSVPSGVAVGNVLVAVFGIYLASGLTAPSGWTLQEVQSNGGANWVGVYTHTVASGDPTSYTWTFGSAAGQCIGVIAGYSGVSTVDATGGTWGSSSTAPNAPAVTTTQVSDIVLYIFCEADIQSSSVTAGPSGATTRLNYSGASQYPIYIGDFTQATTGATPVGTATCTSSPAWVGITLAFKLDYAAPNAPTLQTPANASYLDASSGVTFSAVFNSADGQSQTAYALECKLSSGSYLNWDASTSTWASGSAFWNPDSVSPGGTITVTVPAGGFIANGNTLNWSMASQGAGGSGFQGPFASPFTFTTQANPSVTVTAPTGTETGSSQPFVSWTPSLPAGASQTAYQIQVESGSYGTTPGSGTSVWNSGVVSGSVTSAQIGVALTNGTTYRAFVQITETGGQTSTWGYTTFTISLDVPATPTLTATATTDANGCPIIQLVAQAHDNYLSTNDSSFETGVGTWTAGSNTTISQSSSAHEDGSYSLKLVASASGGVSAQTATGLTGYAVTAGTQYSAVGSFLAGSTARSCTIAIEWYNSSGTLLSTSTGSAVNDATGSWTQANVTATAPSSSAFATVLVSIASLGASEAHYLDEVGLFLGTYTTWSIGGFVGSTLLSIQRSDGQWVRNASNTTPASIPSATQLVTVDDYEVPTYTSYTYTAYISIASPALTSSGGTSGSAELQTTEWWELDPLNYSSATDVQMLGWTPVNTEQSTGHLVTGMPTMNVVADTMMHQDFSAQALTYDAAHYTAFQALLTGQRTIWISSSFGAVDCGWFRIGPQSGGMSSGFGNQAKQTTLKASTAAAPWREISITAVAQQRPPT